MSDSYIAGGFQPTIPDTPLDARTVVNRDKDIFDIKLPYVGMDVYVNSTNGLYVVTGLKENTMGTISVPGYSDMMDTTRVYVDTKIDEALS